MACRARRLQKRYLKENKPVKIRSCKFRLSIFSLCLLMAVSFSYFQFNTWGEIRFATSQAALANLEDADGDDLVLDPPANAKGTFFSSLPVPRPLDIHSCQDSPLLPFQFSPKEEIFILRC
jgi:hypothetical protein